MNSEKITIKNSILIGDDSNLIKGKHIIICGDKIEKITDDKREEGRIVDADGAFLIPGLMNLHVHINRRNVSRGTGTFRMGAPAIELLPDGERILMRHGMHGMS